MKNSSKKFSPVNLYTYLDTLNYGESTEIPEVYLGEKRLFPCRLVLYRLTPEQLEARRKKQAKVSTSLKFDYSAKTLALSEFNLFITNVPCSKLPLHDMSKLYSLRWQVELLFKTWKSYFNIHRTKASKPQRFNCQLYGRLISILLSTSLMFQMRQFLYKKRQREISELESTRIIRYCMEEIGDILTYSVRLTKLIKLLHKIFSTIDWLGTKCQRYEKPKVFNILLAPTFLKIY